MSNKKNKTNISAQPILPEPEVPLVEILHTTYIPDFPNLLTEEKEKIVKKGGGSQKKCILSSS